MVSQYLTKTISAVVKLDTTQVDPNFGIATCTLRPDVNQFWSVTLVRIAAGMQPQSDFTAQVPYCALYAGAASLGASPSNFLDDTNLGGGDSSSIISGIITMFGDVIVAQWSGATIGDTVTLTVYGRSYDSLLELQSELSPVPGARFSGTQANATAWSYQTFSDNGGPYPLNGSSFPSLTVGLGGVPYPAEITSFKYRVITSATVANRSVGVRYLFPDGTDACRVFAPGVQGAGGTVDYSFAQGLNAVNDTQPFQTAALPQKLIVPSGTQVFASVLNIQAGDTWNLFSYTFRFYQSSSIVGGIGFT